MNTKDKVLLLVGIPTVIYILWLFRQVLQSWSNVGLLLTTIALAQLLVGVTILAIGSIVYGLTVFRAQRYAKWLREAGYAVHLDTTVVKEFTIAAIISVITGPIAILITWNQYLTYLCIKAGECFEPNLSWYFYAIVLPLLFSLIALVSLYQAVTIWRNSFGPLKGYWEKVRRGVRVELERTPAITRKE